MNILYYIPYLTKEWGGVYQYALSLLTSLAEDKINKNQFYVYMTNDDESYLKIADKYDNIHLITPNHKPLLEEPFLVEKTEPFDIAIPPVIKTSKKSSKLIKFFAIRYNYRLRHKFKQSGYKEMYFLEWLIRKNHIEIIHCPFQSIYTIDNIPAITTMHDVQELYFPHFFTSADRAARAINYKEAIDKAAAVIVSYQHIKKDILKFFSKPESQVHVCLIDMKDLWFDKFNKRDRLNLDALNLPNQFILYPAATWEHKNHIKLLEAINFLKTELNFNVYLVATGHKNDFYKIIEQKIEQLGLEQNVSFLEIVSDQILYSLYQTTSAVVVPTLYEAGSFPLIESILMNIPVICSNVTSLPEIIQNEKFIFDPYNYKDIADKIYKILTQRDFIEENLSNSYERAKNLRSNNISENINIVYRMISESNGYTGFK